MKLQKIVCGMAVLAACGVCAAETEGTNWYERAAARLKINAFAEIQNAYWARGVIVDRDPFSAQYVGLDYDLGDFGHIGGYAWSVSSMSHHGQSTPRQNFYNEFDYVVYYGYNLELTEDVSLDTTVGPKFVALPGYHDSGDTVYEWNLRQELKNPFVTPYYLMRRAYHPCDWCYWDVGLTRSWELCEGLTFTLTAFAELGNSRHLLSQYGRNPHDDGKYSDGIMALNLQARLDYALTDWCKVYVQLHQFDVVSRDGRDALGASHTPESVKDLTLICTGLSLSF